MMDMVSLNNHEKKSLTMIEKINKTLADLGSTVKWKRAPEFLEDYEPLRGKKLVMVDDVKMLLESFTPELMVATDGNASFVAYTGQNTEELIKQIMQDNPDIVLMDYHLSDSLKGSAIIEVLKGENFTGQAVGFSSDNSATKEFIKAGAKGAVRKEGGDPEISVSDLAKLISED